MKTLMTGLSFLAVIAFVFGGMDDAQAKDPDMNTKMFKMGSMKYWRGNAQGVQLGSYGEKKSGPYLAVQKNIKKKHLKKKGLVKGGKVHSINWNSFSQADVSASASSYIRNNGGTGTFSRKKAASAKLVLKHFYINEGALKGMLNKNAKGALNYLKKEGGDGRVVSSVWVVMEAQIAEDITNGGSISVSGTAKGLKFSVTASGSKRTTTSFTLPEGSTFAYMTHKVKKWNKKKGKKTNINNMEDDQVGLR